MGTMPETRWVSLNGEAVIQARCPGCGQWGEIDGEQYIGRVSIDCPDCEYHETHDLSKARGGENE